MELLNPCLVTSVRRKANGTGPVQHAFAVVTYALQSPDTVFASEVSCSSCRHPWPFLRCLTVLTRCFVEPKSITPEKLTLRRFGTSIAGLTMRLTLLKQECVVWGSAVFMQEVLIMADMHMQLRRGAGAASSRSTSPGGCALSAVPRPFGFLRHLSRFQCFGGNRCFTSLAGAPVAGVV